MLASNASLLACFYLLLNGRILEETERRLNFNSRAMRSLLSRLTTARIIEIDAN